MPTSRALSIWLLAAVLITGCSFDVGGPTTPTLLAPPPAEPGRTTTACSPPPVSIVHLPITWEDLNLKGRMVLLGAELEQGGPVVPCIQVLDLESGELSTIMRSPYRSWIYYMTASEKAQRIVISYELQSEHSPPHQQALYELPLDGSRPPELVFEPPSFNDLYIQVEWSPDGKYLYYVHVDALPQTPGPAYPIYEIFRKAYPNGKAERVAENAFWPRISADSARLVYVSSSPTEARNGIIVADADGSNAREVPLQGSTVPEIIDAPLFSPDGQTILFSAPSPAEARRLNWMEKLMGVEIALAHSVPSDWWSVPVGGGTPRLLTQIQSASLYASASPDGTWIASYSGSGLFVMKPDGSELTSLIANLGGIVGMVDWLP